MPSTKARLAPQASMRRSSPDRARAARSSTLASRRYEVARG